MPIGGTGILHAIWIYRNPPELETILELVEHPARGRDDADTARGGQTAQQWCFGRERLRRTQLHATSPTCKNDILSHLESASTTLNSSFAVVLARSRRKSMIVNFAGFLALSGLPRVYPAYDSVLYEVVGERRSRSRCPRRVAIRVAGSRSPWGRRFKQFVALKKIRKNSYEATKPSTLRPQGHNYPQNYITQWDRAGAL
ncbi:hypothetical protein DFH07DRAFT_780778 [Mycena maculata]|uniref:Uncharacterized protein n=1 Tax=Mycena maculata TaxID=230809 RepID=A0AAD7I333_9AGAR|nr:hypothetical protein DFH07DRAFT_780778 [Mycena maculata]